MDKITKRQEQDVFDYIEYKSITTSDDWQKNVKSLLLRVVKQYNFYSPKKTDVNLLKIIGKGKKTSLKFYFAEILRYIRWLTNYSKYEGKAKVNHEVLLWARGDNFIADLMREWDRLFKKKKVDKTDKKKKYASETVGRQIEILMKLDIPEYYKRMCRLVFFMNPRRRKAVVHLFLEHIDTRRKTITFYEKEGREFEVEFTEDDFFEILQWKKERLKRSKEIYAIHPDTKEHGRPLFLNEHNNPVTRNGISVYFSLLKKRPICPSCYGFINKKSKKCMKCDKQILNLQFDPIYLKFNFHLGRGGHASRLLDEGYTLTEVAHFGGWESIQVLRDNYDASESKKAFKKILDGKRKKKK